MSAKDPMGQAAAKAATFATKLDFYLLAAASESATREARAEALRRFFSQWPKFARAVSELESIAPNAARDGYAEDRRTLDFIEGRGA